MKKYTIESLKELNLSYDSQHVLIQSDVDKANKLVKFIESTRTKNTPQVGDMVEFTSRGGNYYECAHIDTILEDEIYICEQPHVPFVNIIKTKNELSTCTSGGAWTYIPKNLEYIGIKEKLFTDWGHCGPCGNGAIKFKASVSVWKYTEGNPEFTTKTHDNFFVSIVQEPNPYKYIIRRNSANHTAFRTDEEYNAWLKTFHGVEKDGLFGNKVVWTYKQEELCVPLEEYLSISNAIKDSVLCNCTIQECKRIIEGTKITTYMPFQHNKIPLDVKVEYVNAYKN